MCMYWKLGESRRPRTEDSLVPRLWAEMGWWLSSRTKAGTHCCSNGRAARAHALLSGRWALVQFRVSALGMRFSLDGECALLLLG